jgi:uncharacterized protein
MIELASFLSRHREALEQDQARHNLMLGLLARAEKDPEKVRLWSLGDGAACALQTPPHYLVLGELEGEHCVRLAEEVKDLDFAGCIGSGTVPERLATALAAHGVELVLGMPQRIYVLTDPPKFPGAVGSGRRAEAADKDLYLDWTFRFMEEAVPHDPAPSRKELEQKALERPVYFWEVDGRPVAMASRSRETRNGSNISLVYTPPESRGKGYGGSVTAFASAAALGEGKEVAFLYTDLRNPVSNRVYQKIGFRAWCDASTYVRG